MYRHHRTVANITERSLRRCHYRIVFIAPLQTVVHYVVNKRPLTELCAPLAIRVLIANSCTRWREIFKDLPRMEGRIFLKISSPLSWTNTYQMNLISAGFISLYSTFNPIPESRPWKSDRQSAPTSDVRQSTFNNHHLATDTLTTRYQQQSLADSSTRQSTVNHHHSTTDTPDNQEPCNNNYRQTAASDNQQSTDYCWLLTINNQQPTPENGHTWQPGTNNNYRQTTASDNQQSTTITRQPTRLTTRNQQQLPTDNSTWQTTAPDNQQSADYCWLSTNKYSSTDRYTRDNQNQHLTTNRQKSTGWKYSKTRLEAIPQSSLGQQIDLQLPVYRLWFSLTLSYYMFSSIMRQTETWQRRDRFYLTKSNTDDWQGQSI